MDSTHPVTSGPPSQLHNLSLLNFLHFNIFQHTYSFYKLPLRFFQQSFQTYVYHNVKFSELDTVLLILPFFHNSGTPDFQATGRDMTSSIKTVLDFPIFLAASYGHVKMFWLMECVQSTTWQFPGTQLPSFLPSSCCLVCRSDGWSTSCLLRMGATCYRWGREQGPGSSLPLRTAWRGKGPSVLFKFLFMPLKLNLINRGVYLFNHL